MTTNKNFKSKKVSNQYSHFFDIKKLLPKVKKHHRDDKFSCKHRCETLENTQNKRLVNNQSKHEESDSCECAVDNLNPFYGKGRPYLLLSEDDTQDIINGGRANTQRDPVCYNVLHERAPRIDMSNIASLIKGIRISICVEHTRFPLISKISKGMAMTHVPEHRLWNIQWCDNTPHFDLLKSMKRFQQINHFPGMSEICRKDLLSRNLNRMLKMFPGDYRIFPKTWLLPTDAYDVAVYDSKHKRTYILKPYSSGQGRGIWLTNNLRNVRRHEKLICQTYIDRPLLIDGYKFDLRVYILVTSVDPLRIFVYNEGLARFATHKYMPPALNNSNNVYMHLTNYCVNRHNSNYDAGSGTEGGSKRNLSSFNKWLLEHDYSADEFWASVDDAIIKTVISAWPVLKHNYKICFPKHDKIQACFQLLGFDILVDWKLKPYILEVNHTPSLSADETVDHEVKRPLIRDTLNMLSTPLVDKEEIIREDRAVLRDRMMRQANRRRVVSPGQSPRSPELRQSCSFGALAQQIAWEESHLGNYRRIMPPTDVEKVAYYCKFYKQAKAVSMFKQNNVSRSRLRIHQELVEQQLALQQQNAEKDQRRQQKLSLDKQVIQVDFEPTEIQLETQKKLEKIVAKDIRRQKKKLLQETDSKHVSHPVWQAVNTSRAANTPTRLMSSPSVRLKNKRSVNIMKAHRRKQRRQIQRRTRLSRRLEWESRQDAEFLQRHGISKPEGSRLQGGNSKLQLSSSSSRRHQALIKKNKPKAKSKTVVKQPKKKPEITCDKCRPKKTKLRTKTIERIINDWLPERITESETHWQKEWRRQRSADLNDQQFRELLFNEMYDHGHLTKNDIKLFPNLLYRILKSKTSTDSTPESA